MSGPGLQATLDGRDQVLDLWVALEPDEFGDLDGAKFANFSQVVAEKISDHNQLGHFFGAGLEFVSELRIARGIGRARSGALYGSRLNLRTAEAQEQFRGGGNDFEFSAVEVSGERGGRNGGEVLEQAPARKPISGGEPLGEVHLVDVSRSNIRLGLAYDLEKGLARKRRAKVSVRART